MFKSYYYRIETGADVPADVNVARLNRTIIELKLALFTYPLLSVPCLNRTIIELKRVFYTKYFCKFV